MDKMNYAGFKRNEEAYPDKIFHRTRQIFGTIHKKYEKVSVDAQLTLMVSEIFVVSSANQDNVVPDWDALIKTITGKYDQVFADRTVTKAKIYYSYGKDWPVFTAAIVHYTEAYENKEDYKLMNKNANFILKYSSDKSELKTALGWMQPAAAKEPANETYRETVRASNEKLNKISPT